MSPPGATAYDSCASSRLTDSQTHRLTDSQTHRLTDSQTHFAPPPHPLLQVATGARSLHGGLGDSSATLVYIWFLVAAGGLAVASPTEQPRGHAFFVPHMTSSAVPVPWVTIDGDVVLRTESDVNDALAHVQRALGQTAALGQSNNTTQPKPNQPPVIINGVLSIKGPEIADHHLERFLPMVLEVRGPVVVSDTQLVHHLDSFSQLTKVRYATAEATCCLCHGCALPPPTLHRQILLR